MTSERMSDAEIAAIRERAAFVDDWRNLPKEQHDMMYELVFHDVPRLCDELEEARRVLGRRYPHLSDDSEPILVGMLRMTGAKVKQRGGDGSMYWDFADEIEAYLRTTDAARSTEGE